ncbi:MAG: hypothetical protein N2Z22_03225 [Turneriella sp.]|nr:hypothetical protein [Turneriella sp.]
MQGDKHKTRTAVQNRAYLLALVFAANCTQSAQVFAPVNNVAPGASNTNQTYSLTLNITSPNPNHQNQPFSVLLFRGSTLVAAQYNNGTIAGTDRTNATGNASLVVKGVDGSLCPTTTPAQLESGNYTLFFAIQYSGETATAVNPGSCGANGWIQSSASGNNLFGLTATISINSDTTYNINALNLVQFRQHTFSFSTGSSWNYRCFVLPAAFSTMPNPAQPLSVYERSGNGNTSGIGMTTHLLPVGSYRYFCYADTNTNGNYTEAGVDKIATGLLTVSGAGTTALNAAAFSSL